MTFESPGEILFDINGFAVYSYGVVMAIACLLGIYISYLIYKKYNPISAYEKIIDFSAMPLIIGILGARLYYCILNPIYYFTHPIEILDFRQGGLSIHGGLLFGISALIFFAHKYKLGVLNILDSFACGTVFAQSVGRWGNFFNSEAFGLPTDLPWKLYIPLSKRPDVYADYEYFHPAFLYESILDLFIFCLLLIIMNKTYPKNRGYVFFSYLGLYSIARILVEQLRIDSALNVGLIPIAQVVSIILFVIAVSGIIVLKNKSKFIQNK